MPEKDITTVEQEDRYHHYTGNRIPWYVHLLWLLFWTFTVYYMLKYFVPALHQELLSPP